jgi:hypothetical protein
MIDDKSSDGAWLREWIAQTHSNYEWRRHVQEQQQRIAAYVAEIEKLRFRAQRMEDALRLISAMDNSAAQIAEEVLDDL